jgi:ribosomal protein S27E
MGRVIGDGQPIKKQAKDNIIMHKRTIEVITGEKAEGILDPSKKGVEMAGPPKEQEVTAHGREVYVTCPQCNSVRFVYLEYEGEWFTCANCGTSYSVTI